MPLVWDDFGGVKGLRQTNRRKGPGQPNRRDPDLHLIHEPLLGPQNGRDHLRGLMAAGKAAIIPQV
jgi:hypothetical protein